MRVTYSRICTAHRRTRGDAALEMTERYAPLLYFGFAAAVVSAYVLAARFVWGEVGFPLDDAWIHQVYARNLGLRGEFSFVPGQPSAGSTAPLWTVVLAPIYRLGLDSWLSTIALGAGLLGASAWRAAHAASFLTSDRRLSAWVVPGFFLLNWHLVWAAASGMEVILFVFLTVLCVELLWAGAHPALLGLLAGLVTLTRPEGVIFGGIILAGVLLRQPKERARATGRLAESMLFVVPAVLLLLPVAWFNLQVGGSIVPNTFHAKAQEYAALAQELGYLERLAALMLQPIIGAPILLVPGLVFIAARLASGRRWVLLLPAAWILILPMLYAWRLAVVYQHGRYLMPIIPFVLLYGAVGTANLLARIPLRVIRRAWAVALVVLLVVFATWGALLYRLDVGIINCELVSTAKWIKENIPRGELIAVHDIGAQGYIDPRPILDMAGLVTTEVIPFMRDEARLLEWMKSSGARYAVFFPSWYPTLASSASLKQIYSTECAESRELGETGVAVYAIIR